MEKFWMASGALLMFVSIAAGAFGAHGLKGYFAAAPYAAEVFQKAVFYHMIHALALFVVAGSWMRGEHSLLWWAGILFLAGIFLFSGSLYLLSLTQSKGLGAVTPFGGLAFLAGWLCLFLAALKA